MILNLVELARPKDWVKNVFILMPMPFALASGARIDAATFVSGLGAFCLCASAIYAINDIQDAERDRAHETKRNRPVASGRVPISIAYGWALVLAAASIGLGAASGREACMWILGFYVVLNLIYSLGGKNIPLLDVFFLSSFYMLRVLMGCALVDVEPSNWLLLCSGALALFLALAKRRADVVKGLDESHRPALSGYTQGFLDQAMGITACMTIVAYALYSMEAVVLIEGREFAALPFVVFGVLDVLRVAHLRKEGGSPVDLLLGSPALITAGVLYLIATIWSLKF